MKIINKDNNIYILFNSEKEVNRNAIKNVLDKVNNPIYVLIGNEDILESMLLPDNKIVMYGIKHNYTSGINIKYKDLYDLFLENSKRVFQNTPLEKDFGNLTRRVLINDVIDVHNNLKIVNFKKNKDYIVEINYNTGNLSFGSNKLYFSLEKGYNNKISLSYKDKIKTKTDLKRVLNNLEILDKIKNINVDFKYTQIGTNLNDFDLTTKSKSIFYKLINGKEDEKNLITKFSEVLLNFVKNGNYFSINKRESINIPIHNENVYFLAVTPKLIILEPSPLAYIIGNDGNDLLLYYKDILNGYKMISNNIKLVTMNPNYKYILINEVKNNIFNIDALDREKNKKELIFDKKDQTIKPIYDMLINNKRIPLLKFC